MRKRNARMESWLSSGAAPCGTSMPTAAPRDPVVQEDGYGAGTASRPFISGTLGPCILHLPGLPSLALTIGNIILDWRVDVA